MGVEGILALGSFNFEDQVWGNAHAQVSSHSHQQK